MYGAGEVGTRNQGIGGQRAPLIGPQRLATQEGLAGLVERVTYHTPENRSCVLRAKARGHRNMVTVGGHAASIAAGEWITASGEWVKL